MSAWKTTAMIVGMTLLVTVGLTVPARASTGWAEVGDAGELPPTAQLVQGPAGALTSISGANTAADADMYRICLTGGKTFSATTVGGAAFDTQLFLFTATGLGVYANDDGASTLQATLPSGHTLTPAAAGAYYLAISRFDRDPGSVGGLIFPSTPFSDVAGPTGPGGGSPISGWLGLSGDGGGYTITLTGAQVCLVDVDVDIKPGGFPNSIKLSNRGAIPVAILTTPAFDATTVDPTTVCFGDAETAAERDCTEAHRIGRHIGDVDFDGDVDLLLHYETRQTGIDLGDTQACLTGTTFGGMAIGGCDGVRPR